MDCNNIITIPQFTGTCWFNAVLMILFYSENMKKLVEHKTKYFKVEGKNKKANGLRFFHAFVRKLLSMSSNLKMKDNVMFFFTNYSPEHVLLMLHNFDPGLFSFDVQKQCGFHALIYLEKLFILLDISYKIIVEDDEEKTFYNTAKRINTKEEKEEKEGNEEESFDIILVMSKQYMYGLNYLLHRQITNEIDKSTIIISDKEKIALGKNDYIIESAILKNGQGKNKHEIAGLTCQNNRYLYNGWLLRELEQRYMLFFKKRNKYPCELFKYDWVNDKSRFCIDSTKCFFDKQKKGRINDICFNLGNDVSVRIFINAKIISDNFDKKSKPENKIVKIDFRENPRLLKCLREVANLSHGDDIYMYDSPKFDKDILLKNMDMVSPKLKTLSKKISELDARDMKKQGKLYKHCIYTDVKSSHGIKILASMMKTLGFEDILNENHKFRPDTSKFKSFGILTKKTLYKKPVNVTTRKNVLQTFNQRPENTHGEKLRVILLDNDFKEGVDLFDVKYVHVFEPQLSLSDTKQVIGRSTRSCGQAGLTFIPNVGWPLYVNIYDTIFQEKLQQFVLFSDTFHEYIIENMGINLKLYNLALDLEDISIIGSVDYELNKTLHNFKPFSILRYLGLQKGGGISNMYNDDHNEDLYQKNKQLILNKFSDDKYKWSNLKKENKCIKSSGNQEGDNSFSFSPSQNFIKDYFVPDHFRKGMLLWHSVGTGKTCSAIAVASNAFETEKYTILWVTRASLKDEIWKNMFDVVCNIKIQELMKNEGVTKKDVMEKNKRYLSDSWNIRPLSYKQFSNMISGKNEHYKELVKRNGKDDPLRKTLIIIDEAQKLYNQQDLSGNERPNMKIFETMVNDSYNRSQENSVRLLLLSGTPYNNDPMAFIKLLNLMKTEEGKIEENEDKFFDDYLNESGKFSPQGKTMFLNKIAGHISYLNQSNDVRKFAQPQIENIHTVMSLSKLKDTQNQLNIFKEKVKVLTSEKKSQENILKKNEKAREKNIAKCSRLKGKEKNNCVMNIVTPLTYEIINNSDILKKGNDKLNEAKKMVEKIKLTIPKKDLSQESAIIEKCLKK